MFKKNERKASRNPLSPERDVQAILEKHDLYQKKQQYPFNSILGTFFHNHRYFISYFTIKLKRYSIETAMIFLFQFLIIINLTSTHSLLPLYPPLGLAFSLFYLLGNSALLGLIAASIFGYYLKGFHVESILLYSLADVGGGFLGSILCQKILRTDIRPFLKDSSRYKFMIFNAFLICSMTSLLRIFNILLQPNFFELNMKFGDKAKILFFYLFNFWLSDLNAILVFSAFLLSWVYIFYSREQISKISIMSYIIFLIIAFLSFSKNSLFYMLLLTMISSIVWAIFSNYLVSSALMLIVSVINLVYLINQKHLMDIYSLQIISIPPLLFLLYINIMFLISYSTKFKNKSQPHSD